jgi:hypothetical protein
MDSENWKCGPPLRGFPISCFRDLPKKLAESEPGRVLASHMSDLVSHRGKTSEASGPKDQCNVHRVFVCRAIQLRADFLKLTETEGSRFFVACNISSHRVVLHSQSSYLIQKLIVEGRPTGVQDGVRGMLEHAYRTGCSLLLSYCVPFAGGNDDCYWDLSVLKTGPQDDQEARKPVLGISSDNLDVNWRDDRGFEFSLRDGVKERIKVYTEEFARTSTVIDLDTPAQSDAPRVENEGACKLAATNKKLKGLVDALVKQRKSIVEQLNSNEQQRKEDAMERQRLQVQ